MTGFFKKLFNRMTGKPVEEVAAPVVEPVALPAPLPLPEPEIVEAELLVARPHKIAEVQGKAKKSTKVTVPPKKVAPQKTAPKVRAKVKSKAPSSPKPLPVRKQTVSITKTAVPKVKRDARLSKLGAPALREKPTNTNDVVKPPDALQKVQLEPIVPQIIPVFPEAVPVHVVVMQPAPRTDENVQRSGWFARLKDGLSKSSTTISGSITSIFTKRKLDKATLQELEDTLIQADLGLPVAERIIAQVSHGRYDKEIDPAEVKRILAAEVAKVLKPVEVPFTFGSEKPFVIAVVGVNGSGKTTTIGKLGSIATGEGYKVMFAAGDTFRAAAIEQLTVWGKRIGAETISRPQGADAAGLAFDALKEAQSNGTDILFIDTAGRLQNKAHLMDELDKMVRVIKKLDVTAPHAVLLVLDATTGQNALAQAEIFTKVAGVTGLIMTKLDGTARGGILVAIAEKFKLPIHAIGVGETIDDLQPFDADGFARAIAGLDEK